jgi:hypothetical protein
MRMIRSLRHFLQGLACLLLFAGVSAAQVTRTFANPTPLVIPATGPSAPYGTSIPIANVFNGIVTNVSVTLKDVTHPNPAELRLILVGPNGQTAALFDTTPGFEPLPTMDPMVHRDLTFSNRVGFLLWSHLQTSGPYRPYGNNLSQSSLPVPAPPKRYPGAWTPSSAPTPMASGHCTSSIRAGRRTARLPAGGNFRSTPPNRRR